MENGTPENEKSQEEKCEKSGEPEPDMHKTSPYVQTVVYLHNFRDRAKDTVDSWKERGLADRLHDGWSNTRNTVSSRTRSFFTHPDNVQCKHIPQKYSYVFRPKSRWELVLLSGTVCGIEFCYAAETAFVTPILLSLGLSIKFVTMIWCLSPLIGLLLTPILGSMSDTCKSKLGRRRPFIIMYSIGILLGLILVPNGHHIGLALGDTGHHRHQINQNLMVMLNGTSYNEVKFNQSDNLADKLLEDSTQAFDKKDTLLSLTSEDASSQVQADLKSTLRSTEQRHRSLDMEDVLPKFRFRSSESKIVTMPNEKGKQNKENKFSNLIDIELDDNKTEVDEIENSSEYVYMNLNKASFENHKPDDNDVFPQFKNRILETGINKNGDEFQNFQTTLEPENEENYSNNNIPEYLTSKSDQLLTSKETAKRPHDEKDVFLSSLSDKAYFGIGTNRKDTTNENVVNELKSDLNVPFQDTDDEFSQLIDMEEDSSSEEQNTNPETKTKFRNSARKSSRVNDIQDTFPARRMSGNIHSRNELPNFQTVTSIKTENPDTEKEVEDNEKEIEQPITANEQSSSPEKDNSVSSFIQPWSIVFTVIGTVLLDFCSDACQSPSRTYLLDVSMPSDHAAGLSTFTVMAGLGGSIGYMMGAVHWETTFLGRLLGGQVNAVFLIVTVIFLICLLTTVCSFPEIPLSVFEDPKMNSEYQEKIQNESIKEVGNEMSVLNVKPKRYGSTDEAVEVKTYDDLADETNNYMETQIHSLEKDQKTTKLDVSETNSNQHKKVESKDCRKVSEVDLSVADQLDSCHEQPTLKDFLRSIVEMPKSLRILCLTNLFCWMSLVCYSLYFTDFVGECVFEGDPQAPEDSESFLLYQEGVQFGCWGMALYSISCSIYSFFIEALVKKVGAKRTYIGGQLVYSCGMVIMALARHKIAVILLSPTAGVMYSTLFTMPYLLIAHYHSTKQFSDDQKGSEVKVRGIGTDVAAVSSMVFLSQFVLSLSMGSIVEAIGSNVVPVCAAAVLSACGALSATQVTYLDI